MLFLLYFVIKLFTYYTSFGLFLVYEDFFFLSGGYAKRNILLNEEIHSDDSSNLKKHG